jgi:hypothetical protein
LLAARCATLKIHQARRRKSTGPSRPYYFCKNPAYYNAWTWQNKSGCGAVIAQVQANPTNMQALNDYIYNQGNSRVTNAYLLLSEQDSSDPGLTVGLNILEGVFWAVGSELGPIGNFLASFLSGMVSWWASNTPPSLNTTFASLLIRLQQTSLAVDTQLATYYQNVAANWDVQFTYNGQTQTLANLANITVPA